MNPTVLMGLIALASFSVACARPAASPAAVTEDAGPKYGGTFTKPVRSDPFDWDITYQGTTVPNDVSMGLGYNSLLNIKPGGAFAELSLIPALAESWDVSPDAKSFTYRLRHGV